MEILKALWKMGSGSVRGVHEFMCPNEELAFNTIQTLLRIMDEKGLVTHEVKGRTFVYRPNYTRDRAAARFLDVVFDGAMDQVVQSLLRTHRPDAKELKRLEEIIAESRQRKRKGK